MKYYPVNLDIRNRNCLVVGGGQVGSRKVKTLIECGAKVTVVSPVFTDSLLEMASDGVIRVETRGYETSDLNDKFLVICATDIEELNWKVSKDAEKRNMLCNIADFPAACNFILPSIVKRGDMTISVSTSGKSPAFAKKMRKDIEAQFGPEYGPFLELMGAVRAKLLSEAHEPEAHKPLFEQIIAGGLLDLVAAEDVKNIDALLFEVLGDGYTFNELMENG